ncbi:MAG: hypothetical protein EU549_02075 [Promethearchaeota archaeon]|nr:MAG: hypothetical protein EU549_02075 [Candidatus Lokiarchaeota archaeon]
MFEEEIKRIKVSSDLNIIKKDILNLIKIFESDNEFVKRSILLKIFDNSIFNYTLIEKFQTKIIIEYLINLLNAIDEEKKEIIVDGLNKRIQGYLIKIVKNSLDIGHNEILNLIEKLTNDSEKKYNLYFRIASTFNEILNNEDKHSKFTNIERERIAKILADLHGLYLYNYVNEDKKMNFHLKLKNNYENLILNYQKTDLKEDLQNIAVVSENLILKMAEEDYDKEFIIYSPLRLGLSSANASDNHTRAKEKGGKALNASINISLDLEKEPTVPITVSVKRLDKTELRIKSIDLGEEFHLSRTSNQNHKSFFRYRYDTDELQLLKQALVHVGIINEDSKDPLRDVLSFTNGGGLELITNVGVFKGTGLGTSSILSACLLKSLYRISEQPKKMTYPILYDQSLLLEQSIGFNSGWQDARGAIGGKSAVKHFTTRPTMNLPNPQLEFIELDEKLFEKRISLFYTGIRRFATTNLNVVLDAYLSRDYLRYPAIRQSFLIHEQMVQALKNDDYTLFGNLCSQYWKLRKTIDPSASPPLIESFFEKLEKSGLIEGGLLTGAGGGGFAVLVSKEGKKSELIEFLKNINIENSFVANFSLNKKGITLKEK